MSQTMQQIYDLMNQFYPFSTQMSFDNAGFLLGDKNQSVKKILVALDITSEVIDEAIENHCDMIITHHPIIFTPLKSILTQNPTESMIIKLIQHKIGVISAHTNLDRSQEGVNYHLAKRLGLQDATFLQEEGTDPNGNPYGLGFMGSVSPCSATEFGKFVVQSLDCLGIRITDAGTSVSRVAVGGGSCGSMLDIVAKQGCDTFVTGDVKYDQFLDAKERGINLIDAGHFPTEQVICQPLAEKLQNHYTINSIDINVVCSKVHKEVSSSL